MTVIAIASARKYQRLETLVVAVLAACVVAFAVTWAFTRSQQIDPPPLLDWQVSSLADLGEDDLDSAASGLRSRLQRHRHVLSSLPGRSGSRSD